MNPANDILLSGFNFEEMRQHVLHILSTQLPSTLLYHSYEHTLDAETIATQIAEHENLDEIEVKLVRTAALYHDLGFIYQHENNEELAMRMAKEQLVTFDFSHLQIELIQKMIQSTRAGFKPQNNYDKILSDADHDYFGREDYFEISDKLKEEFIFFGQEFTELEWIQFQLNYLEKEHVFWTNWSKTKRFDKKNENILKLKIKQEKIINENLH